MNAIFKVLLSKIQEKRFFMSLASAGLHLILKAQVEILSVPFSNLNFLVLYHMLELTNFFLLPSHLHFLIRLVG